MRLSTRLTVAMVALVLLATTAVGVLTYRNIAALALPRALDRLQTHAELLGSELAASVRGARADVIGFRSAVAAIDIMNAHLNRANDPAAAALEAELRRRLGRRFEAELASKPNYHEFRYIGVDDGGRELVRVDRSGPGGAPRTVPDGELQRKADRPAFTETIRLPAGEVYVSAVDLNQENGAIETPRVPVLRVATPLYAPDGRPFGIVIINVDMRPAFARIRTATNGGRRGYVVNDQGDYLLHPDPDREFGFEFARPARIQDEFPDFAAIPATGATAPRVVEDRSGGRFGVGIVSLRLAEGPRIAVIEALPYAELMAATIAVRDSSLIAGLAAAFCAVLLAIFVARSLTRPLVQMTKVVEGFSRGETVALPAGGGHEIGVLATAFAGMAAESRAKTTALLESEQMARDVVANSLDAFIQTDEAGDIREWNPTAEAIFGWSRQEALGKQLISLVLPEALQPHRRKMREQLLRSEESAAAGERFEIDAVRKDGHTVKIEVSLTALRRRSGYVVNAFIRDMTQKIAADEQLRQAQKMEAVGQLTGGVAHDFNNVLTVITGTIEILAEEVSNRPDLVAITKLISGAADRGAELTAHLLAFARKQPLQPRDTDVNRLIVEAAKLMRPTLGEHIEIESMLADSIWAAMVDPGQLSSALLNLAINARDAMPDGGKLTLETRNVILDESYAADNGDVRPGNYVMIAVSDTGVGIPEAIRDRVFDPFFSTKAVGSGTGLGLSMVYGFVKQSDGHIKVYSEEGFGTAFKLYLPQAGLSPEQAATAPLSAELEGGHETILVVEDDPLVRSYVTTQLQSLGYKTLSAANGAEALAIADGGAAFDLLFTDVIMPGLNGRQLAAAMAQRRPALKVLFTSGYTENAIIHHGRLDSGVLLLAKPYRKLDLARMLRVALSAAGIFFVGHLPPVS
ncbi:MAG: PAS domain S-box protein [Xanthobacteraceae bacterium]|nr:PAS domain S-box protein [Xanthobacteraceae bacterium]